MNAQSMHPIDIDRAFMPSAAESLRASAASFDRMGLDFDAQFSREMADAADHVGDAVYRHWAAEQAARVLAKQAQVAA